MRGIRRRDDGAAFEWRATLQVGHDAAGALDDRRLVLGHDDLGGLAEQVASVDQRRDRLLLDGRGLLIAQRCQGALKFGGNPQGRETAGLG